MAAGTYAEQCRLYGEVKGLEWRRFNRLRTGQRYEVQGLIFFLSSNYRVLPEELRRLVRESCRAAAGKSGNYDAIFEYMTKGKTKTAVMMRYHIASETTVDRMVRTYFCEMERRLREEWRGDR